MTNLTEQLKLIAQTNETATRVFTALAQKERSKAVTSPSRFRLEFLKDVDVDPAQYAQVWYELHRLGIGRAEFSPIGTILKIHWNYKTRSVGRVALGQDPELEAFVPGTIVIPAKQPRQRKRFRSKAPVPAPAAVLQPAPRRELVTYVCRTKGGRVVVSASDKLSTEALQEFEAMARQLA